MKLKIFLLAVATFGITGTTNAATIRVPADQPTIQAGITVASTGDIVTVAPGTYLENIDLLGKSIVVTSDQGAVSTTLRPANSGIPTVNIGAKAGETPLISGFTFSGSYSNVILIDAAASPTIKDNFFIDNDHVFNVSIKSYGTYPIISNNLFVRSANISCVGIYGGSAAIINNTFDNNRRGFFTISGQGIARNNIVSNSSEYGVFGVFTEFDYNDIWNNLTNYEGGAAPGTHDISADPLYQDPSNLLYTLKAGSPCIDAGDPAPQYNDPDGSRSNMGLTLAIMLPRVGVAQIRHESSLHVVNHLPTFEWTIMDTVPVQTAYELEVGTDQFWNVAEMWSTGQVVSPSQSAAYAGLPLVDGATYFWRIRVFDGIGWSPWDVESFRTNSPPSVPVPSRPLDGTSARIRTALLYVKNSSDAQSDPLSYDFQIFSDPGLLSMAGSQTGIAQTGSETSCPPFATVPFYPAYWWRARASDGFEYSDWSTAQMITPRTGPILVPAEEPTIADGINVAVNGDTVLVAPGVYTENLAVSQRSITLLSSAGSSATTIVASRSDVLRMSGVQDQNPFYIRGFTIRSVYRGVAADNSRFTIEDCDFTGTGTFVHFSGASSVATIHNCRFFGGTTGTPFGVLADNSPTLSLTRCLFVGMYTALQAMSGRMVITNNTFDKNSVGIENWYSSVTARNNIIVNSTGAGMYGASGSSDYNDIWNNHPNYESGTVPGPHDLSLDPLFFNPSAGNYSLLPTSPCMDAGDPDPIYRDPDGTRNDMGAYPNLEGVPAALRPSLGSENPLRVISHTPRFTWSPFDTGGATQTQYELEVGTDTSWSTAEMWASGTVSSGDSSAVYAGGPLLDGSTYFWRVRLYDGIQWGGWREASFHMNVIPSTPVTNSPLAGARVCPDHLQLFVNNSTDGDGDHVLYDYQIFGDETLTRLVGSQSGVQENGTPTASLEFSLLGKSADYWWRSRAYDGYEYSAWSVPERFVIRPATLHVPADWPNPAAAIAASCGGDSVILAHGSYPDGIDPMGKDIVIAGELPLGATVVSAPPYTPPIKISRGESIHMVVRDLVISGSREVPGILISSSSPSILNNLIMDNYGGANGGGVRVQGGGGPVIRGNQFTGNSAQSKGGAIYVGIGANTIIDGNVISGNQARDGSAIAQEGNGNLVIFGNSIYSNRASGDMGGAVYTGLPAAGNSNFQISYNTIANNVSTSNLGAGIVCDFSSAGEITNNVIAFNTGGYGIYACTKTAAPPSIQFNDFWWNSLGPYQCAAPDTGNFFADPGFCDTSLHDFHLAAHSPCLNQGADSSAVGAFGRGCDNAAPLPPICDSIKVDSPRLPTRIVNHHPQIRWIYADAALRPHQFSEVEVGTDDDWTVAEMWDPPVISGPQTAVIYDGLPLEDGRWYYVRVRERNDTLWSAWSVSTFHMNSAPMAPVASAPGNGVVLHLTRPKLSILPATDGDGDLVSYMFAVYSDSTLLLPVDSAGPVTDTSWVTDSLTAENHKYWWRARAWDGFDYSSWSSTRSFWLDAVNEPPTAFDLRSPNDDIALFNPQPALAWDPPVDPDPCEIYFYTVTVSLNPTFTFKRDVFTPQTSIVWPESLYIRATYWWKVVADNQHGQTITSPVRKFTLAAPGDLTGDGMTDIFDVIALIGYAFSGGTAPSPLSLGDTNGDCAVDVFDVIYLIHHVFEGGAEPVSGCY